MYFIDRKQFLKFFRLIFFSFLSGGILTIVIINYFHVLLNLFSCMLAFHLLAQIKISLKKKD